MVLANDMVGEQQSSSIHHHLQRSASPNSSLTSSSSSPSSQALAHEQMSLYELRELATRQQERIETTQRLIMNREQKLKYLKHDTLLNHSINEYDKNLQRLKESVSTQEIKLRQLRALKGQVQKQRCSNSNLCSELESIRTLFNEKEKELSVALTKVDALTRQLEELRKGNTTNSYHINGISNGKHAIELEKLRQELLYRTKLSEQQGIDLTHKKGLLTQRQSEMVQVDKRISELQQRLARKRQLNQQLSSQMHSNLSRTHSSGLGESGLHSSNSILRSSVGHPGHGHKISHLRPLSANIAAVEPLQREQQTRISEIDQHINANKDFTGCKQDPKYQTLPYNTKFGVRQHQQQYKMSAGNHLYVSASETDKNDYELSNDNMNDILVNNISNNVLNNNNNNTNISLGTNNNNNSNTKLMNTKSSFIEERPSPSGSSGSSDRASIQNHNGILPFKIQNNNNNAIAQHYQHQHQNQKIIGMSFENGNHMKQLKPMNTQNNNINSNHNQQNSNQSVSQTYNSVPNNTTTTSSQTQSQFNQSKVPLITKPKPILPPKPSIPVKPIPPPRQTPNHLYSAQIYGDSVDNAFSMSRSNADIDRKASNLLTSSSSPSTSSSLSYRFPLTSLAIQRTYNVINSKSGLMVQQLPHHSQRQQQQQLIHHSYEDKIPSHLNRNIESLHPLSIGNVNETPDVSNLNGQSLIGTDLTSSTSSLSSSLSSQNNANCDTKSMASISSTSTTNTDNNSSTISNSVLLKNESNNDSLSSVKNNSNNVSAVSNSNSLSNDWHKVKRRPVVANNEIEQELAMQISVASKNTADVSVLSQSQTQQSDSKSAGSNQLNSSLSVEDKQTNQCDSNPTKLDTNFQKDNDSEINLINQEQQQRDQNQEIQYNSNSMIENYKENECDEKQTGDNLSPHYTQCKSIGGSKRTKGNLKSQQLTTKGDRNVSRRVSFDPLALLLDAALEGELELVKKTANEVPNPSAANDEGITALHNAICAGHFDIVKYLVENGCDVNAQDSDGWTPLHCAASCNNLAMVKFLVKNGACIFATTLSDQETAAEKCEEDEEGFDGCSQYLYGVQEKLAILNGSTVYAVYDYESQNADELSFKDRDTIIVMRKGDEQEREWWWAKIKDREGYVPRNLLGLYPRVKPNKELQTINEEQCE